MISFYHKLFLCTSVSLLSSCSSHYLPPVKALNNHVQCISTKASSLRKHQIVNNFHQHVKLVGEVDERFTIQQRMDFFNTPAFSVAVINDGRIDWTAAYGVKDITAKEKANCTSLFQTASISKPVTM